MVRLAIADSALNRIRRSSVLGGFDVAGIGRAEETFALPPSEFAPHQELLTGVSLAGPSWHDRNMRRTPIIAAVTVVALGIGARVGFGRAGDLAAASLPKKAQSIKPPVISESFTLLPCHVDSTIGTEGCEALVVKGGRPHVRVLPESLAQVSHERLEPVRFLLPAFADDTSADQVSADRPTVPAEMPGDGRDRPALLA